MTVSPLLYIHGLNSSPASSKARILQAVMQRIGLAGQLRIPALHHHPRQAIAQLQQAIAELGRPLLVGSSLGGYYATFLARQHDLPMLLINPAVLPHRRFAGYLGEQCNHYTGERWWLDETHVQALAELEVPPPEAPWTAERLPSRGRLVRDALRDHVPPPREARQAPRSHGQATRTALSASPGAMPSNTAAEAAPPECPTSTVRFGA